MPKRPRSGQCPVTRASRRRIDAKFKKLIDSFDRIADCCNRERLAPDNPLAHQECLESVKLHMEAIDELGSTDIVKDGLILSLANQAKHMHDSISNASK